MIELTKFSGEAVWVNPDLIQTIEANPDTIRNIRLLDARPSRDTFNQVQSIRPLYFFNDVDIDRYEINGVTTQVMLSARELDIRRAADRNWTNDRLKRTHGYGAVVAPTTDIILAGTGEFYGTILGRTVDSNGTATIHVDESLIADLFDIESVTPIIVQ